MFNRGNKINYRRNYGSKSQDFFDSGMKIFQKTPITVLEELFPNRTTYTWAVARNYGCADLFRCRVRIPNCSGESTSFSKKIAKHQAALEVLINLQKHSGNRDLENFIRNYVCGGSTILCLRSTNPRALSQESFDFQFQRNRRSRSSARSRSRSRARSRSRSRARSISRSRSQINEGGNQRRSRSRSKSRGRSPFCGRDMDGAFPKKFPPMAVRSKTDAVKFLEEECKLAGIPGPQYSQHFRVRANGDLVVYASLGPFTSEGTGTTRELAKQAAAAALIDSFYIDN